MSDVVTEIFSQRKLYASALLAKRTVLLLDIRCSCSDPLSEGQC